MYINTSQLICCAINNYIYREGIEFWQGQWHELEDSEWQGEFKEMHHQSSSTLGIRKPPSWFFVMMIGKRTEHWFVYIYLQSLGYFIVQ